MSLFQSLNQAPFHLDHWVAIIVSGRCRSHSSWMLGQVTHTWPFSRPKPESIFPFSFSFSSPCCRDVEGAPALRLLCPANSRRVFSDRADEMKKKALDCLEAFFHSVCARACRARSSEPGQNVPCECFISTRLAATSCLVKTTAPWLEGRHVDKTDTMCWKGTTGVKSTASLLVVKLCFQLTSEQINTSPTLLLQVSRTGKKIVPSKLWGNSPNYSYDESCWWFEGLFKAALNSFPLTLMQHEYKLV